MRHDPAYRFLADAQSGTIRIRRSFAAPRQMVWDCHTRADLLDQWFAPKPLTTKTAAMDFREGGQWHHAMVAPDGTEYWGIVRFDTINPIDGYTTTDFFSDAGGARNTALPSSTWDVRFEDTETGTRVSTLIAYASPEDLRTVIDMGMEEGMTATLEKLDELLARLTA
ncbi:activator of HSP90 ATPase [Primorskyibacter flagellatus]|uniref:Activator of HSP90 ATPase n=1 Tax=Primorskyibacter flagellatus TaxID=1387277 RepID=A0A916ZX80_9RHOB|nr:SRPBCC domain-containing protein [Primorskyibacter flagellatus]GGE16814.1 activator of HSP90 ATPase [Primorskyibacter flagellatus]